MREPERDDVSSVSPLGEEDAAAQRSLAVMPAASNAPEALYVGTAAVVPPLPSRDRVTRRLAARIYETCPWLQPADAYGVVRLAHLHRIITTLCLGLHRRGVMKKDGTPKKALGELAKLSAEARNLEYSLGLSFTSRVDAGLAVAQTQAVLISVAGGTPKRLEELSDPELALSIAHLRRLRDSGSGNVTQ